MLYLTYIIKKQKGGLRTMHEFIEEIIVENHGLEKLEKIKENKLLQFINDKTNAYNKGAKSRANYGSLFAIYVIIDDYIINEYDNKENDYNEYEGASFSPLFNKMRSLPFGSKLQNHALNNRTNSEFKKKYNNHGDIIIRDQVRQKYWVNEELLYINEVNIYKTIIDIIEKYIEFRKGNLAEFIDDCYELKKEKDINKIIEFISFHISPNADARRFEIISFAILKNYYKSFSIWYGEYEDNIKKEPLNLYKTGRTNANDGGIDFILLPKGEVFQVTETIDFGKYFLDIDKLNKFPISFVVKVDEDAKQIFEKIKNSAEKKYEDTIVVKKYLDCINKIITISDLKQNISFIYKKNNINDVLEDIIKESEVEYNYDSKL